MTLHPHRHHDHRRQYHLFDDWLLFVKIYNSVHVTDFSFNSSDLFSLKVSIIRFVIERPWELTMNCTAERE